MKESSYEFDAYNLDSDDDVTIDTWAKKPVSNTPKIVQSNWRKESINNNFDQQPGIDTLKKIHSHLRKKISDSDIMHAFGINAETLVAIKQEKYSPIDGISLDNQSKIYREFERIHKKMDALLRGLYYISDVLFIEKEDMASFKKACRLPKHAPKKSYHDENDEEE